MKALLLAAGLALSLAACQSPQQNMADASYTCDASGLRPGTRAYERCINANFSQNERRSADNGEVVIAMMHGSFATVKKFYRERDGRIRLQPANETMEPLYVHENDISIQGVVVGVLRRF